MHTPNGPLNWVLIDSSMKLIEAGGGSVEEMSQFFDPKEVYEGGLLRADPSSNPNTVPPFTLTLALTLTTGLLWAAPHELRLGSVQAQALALHPLVRR